MHDQQQADVCKPNNKNLKRKRDTVSFEALLNPSFEELARQFPAFQLAYRDVLALNKGKKLFLETTPDFSLALSRALLQTHWNLQLPHFDHHHHLCPPIPNRYFFVQWLQTTVLPSSRRHFQSDDDGGERIRFTHCGLDIGTGAAAIYALLHAATSTFPCTIYATDIDPNSIHQAQTNVQANQNCLNGSTIHILLVDQTESQRQQEALRLQLASMDHKDDDEDMEQQNASVTPSTDAVSKGPLRCSLDALPKCAPSRLDFCMTNPPFYDFDEEKVESPPPRADGRPRVAMTQQEGSYPGGEFGFVVDMIADGIYLFLHGNTHRDQHHRRAPLWSSCMCGKKSTYTRLRGIVRYLLGPSHVLSTEFGPGHTTRWFLAWTFARPKLVSPHAITKSFSFNVTVESELPHDLPSGHTLEEIVGRLTDYCSAFPSTASRLTLHRLSEVDDSNGQQQRQQRRLRILPQQPEVCTDRDAALPESLQRALSTAPTERRLEWLPREGHFCVDLTLSLSINSTTSSQVNVAVTTYSHSVSASDIILDKIHVQLEGEIARSNRKWRRIRQRQQQQQQQPQKTPERDNARGDTMDES